VGRPEAARLLLDAATPAEIGGVSAISGPALGRRGEPRLSGCCRGARLKPIRRETSCFKAFKAEAPLFSLLRPAEKKCPRRGLGSIASSRQTRPLAGWFGWLVSTGTA
jgi:hypothetical protein